MKIDLDWPAGTFIFEAETWAVVGTPDPANDTYAVLLYTDVGAGAELVALATAENGQAAQTLAQLALGELATTGTLPWS